MTESEALKLMVAPGQRRPNKPYFGGVIQILVTSACNESCFNCTQGSQLRRQPTPWTFMPPEMFEQAVLSLKDYWGVVGVFGGNPAVSPHFVDYCLLLRKHVPWERRGLWCNDPLTVEKGNAMAETFNPAISNLNVHLSSDAWHRFKTYWPESRPFGLHEDSRHSPPFVAMRDMLWKVCPTCDGTWADKNDPGTPLPGNTSLILLKKCPTCKDSPFGLGKVYNESRAWELISRCDVNQHWSASIGVFRGQLRAWFCELAMAQSLLHQNEPDYPDTGLDPTKEYGEWDEVKRWKGGEGIKPEPKIWWQLGMNSFVGQVRKHCHSCGVPLRGFGELSQSPNGVEQVSSEHFNVYRPKKKDRSVLLVDKLEQLGVGRLKKMTDYLGNAKL